MEERKLTDKEERIAQSLPDAEFKKRYGKDWKSVKIATATKMAKMKESIIRKFIKEQIKTLAEAEVKGDIVNLHYTFDKVDDSKEIKTILKNNPILNQYKIKVEFGEDKGNSFDVKFTIDRKKTAAITAIRLLRDEVLEPIEAANKAKIIDIKPQNFQPKIDYDQMAQQSAMDDRRQQGLDPGLEEVARDLGYLNELSSYEMGKLPDFELLRKNVSQMLGVEVDDDVRSGMYNGREGYYSRISRRDLTDWSEEQIEKLKQAFKKTNFESNDYEFEYNSVSDFEVEAGERDYPASFDYFATKKKYGDDDRDNFPDLEESDKDDYGRSVSDKDKRTFVDPKDLTPAARAKKLAGMKEEKSQELKLGVKYDLEGKSGYIMTGGSKDPKDWTFSISGSDQKLNYLAVKNKLTPSKKQPGKYDGAFDLGQGKGHHIDESNLKEIASELGYLFEENTKQ